MHSPVTLYLVRHGLAEEAGDRFPDDSVRPLTGEGIGRLEEEAQGLRVLEVEFDEILTSPYTRARQTAETLARGWAPSPRVSDVDALAPGGTFDDLLEALWQPVGPPTPRARRPRAGHGAARWKSPWFLLDRAWASTYSSSRQQILFQPPMPRTRP